MCGRYASFLPAEAIARIFGAVNPLPNLAPSWNVAPTQSALVVRRHPGTAERHLDLLRWGLLPYWTKEPTKAKRPINARSETAAKSGMFRSALTTPAPVHRTRGRRAGAEWLCREHREGGQAAAVPTVVATAALGGLPARNRSGATDDRRGAGLAAPPQSVRTVFGAHAAKAYGAAGRRGRSTGARATAGRWGVMGLAMCPFQLAGEDIGRSSGAVIRAR